jgi:hypothetical protein
MEMRLWSWYKFVLVNHPLATKATTAGGLMFVSDVLCQTVERSTIHHQTIMIPSEEQEEDPHMLSPQLLQLGGARSTTNVIKAASPIDDHTNDSNDKLFHHDDDSHMHHDWDRKRSIHVAITGLTFSGPISHLWYGLLERLVTTRSGSIAGLVMKMTLDALLFSPVAVAGYFVWRTLLEGSGWEGTRRKLNTKWASAVLASWSFWPAANIMYVSRGAVLLRFDGFALLGVACCVVGFLYYLLRCFMDRNFHWVPLQYRVLYNNCLSLFWTGYLSSVNNRPLMMADGPGQSRP